MVGSEGVDLSVEVGLLLARRDACVDGILSSVWLLGSEDATDRGRRRLCARGDRDLAGNIVETVFSLAIPTGGEGDGADDPSLGPGGQSLWGDVEDSTGISRSQPTIHICMCLVGFSFPSGKRSGLTP